MPLLVQAIVQSFVGSHVVMITLSTGPVRSTNYCFHSNMDQSSLQISGYPYFEVIIQFYAADCDLKYLHFIFHSFMVNDVIAITKH